MVMAAATEMGGKKTEDYFATAKQFLLNNPKKLL